MQEANATSIEYFKDKRRIADVLNGAIFQGRQIITGENLQYENPVIHNISKRGSKISSVENTALQEYVKENEKVFSQLEEDTYDLLVVLSGIRAMELIKKDVENVEGGFNMCKAFDDMMRDSKREGRLEGKREGEERGLRMGVEKGQDQMGKLNQRLISAGRINDLLQASDDRKYREKLMCEFGIA